MAEDSPILVVADVEEEDVAADVGERYPKLCDVSISVNRKYDCEQDTRRVSRYPKLCDVSISVNRKYDWEQDTRRVSRSEIAHGSEESPSKSTPSLTDEELLFLEANLASLPNVVQQNLKELECSLAEGEITAKGYKKKKIAILEPHLNKLQSVAVMEVSEPGTQELIEPPTSSLPKFVVDGLNDLDRELSEEEITLKGYNKKRAKLLAPFMLKEPEVSTLPQKVQEKLKLIVQEYEEGDLTEKGYRKRRHKIMAPYLVKAYAAYSHMSYVTNSDNVVTVVMPAGEQFLEEDRAIGVQIMNGNEKMFKCQICNEVFKQAQSFSGHCRLHRGQKAKSYKCSICKAAYTTRSHLKFHMFKHTGNFPYTCEYCGKGFAGRSQYRYHALRHNGHSPYICKECGGRFWKKRNMEVNCDRHRNDDAPAGLQKCAHCFAMFEKLDDLQVHMYTHDSNENEKAGEGTSSQQETDPEEPMKDDDPEEDGSNDENEGSFETAEQSRNDGDDGSGQDD